MSWQWYYDRFNLNDSITYYIEAGVPRDQIVVGMATFGHAWVLQVNCVGKFCLNSILINNPEIVIITTLFIEFSQNQCQGWICEWTLLSHNIWNTTRNIQRTMFFRDSFSCVVILWAIYCNYWRKFRNSKEHCCWPLQALTLSRRVSWSIMRSCKLSTMTLYRGCQVLTISCYAVS